MSLFDKIRAHWGHKIEVAMYGPMFHYVNAAIECLDCGEVIVDEDAPGVEPPVAYVRGESAPDG